VGQAVKGLPEIAQGAGSAFYPVAFREHGLSGRKGTL